MMYAVRISGKLRLWCPWALIPCDLEIPVRRRMFTEPNVRLKSTSDVGYTLWISVGNEGWVDVRTLRQTDVNIRHWTGISS